MKGSKIIAAILVLIGFGSCANRPSKNKAPENNPEETIQSDTIDVPIRVMYGVPYRQFEPEKEIPQKETPATPAEE